MVDASDSSDNAALSQPQSVPKTEDKEEKHELHQVVEHSNQILVRADTVFPFTLFKDTVSVDRTKVTIIKRNFFMSSETISIRIEDILNVTTTLGPLFGSIKIVNRIFNTEKPTTVDHLWRQDAVRIKHILQGYVIAMQRDIDCSTLSKEKLIPMLAELGHEQP
jgi:hypothetical protein